MEKDDDIGRHDAARGRQGDTGDAAAPVLWRWPPLRARLSPLIGENGFNALFARAVGLVAPRFACLAVDPSPKASSQYFAALERCLALAEPALAQQAEGALMDAFIRQLTALIGPALTDRLLAASPHPDDGQDKDRSTTK